MIAGNMINLCLRTCTESYSINRCHMIESHSASNRQWWWWVGEGVFFIIIIWYCYSLSLEGQRDGGNHVAARHLEGEILNVISVRWHKNSFRVVSDQKPLGGRGGGWQMMGWGDGEGETSTEKHITQRPILFSCASTERGFILTMREWNVLHFSQVEKLLFHPGHQEHQEDEKINQLIWN